MTLECSQSGGQLTGDLQTNSYYVLEQEINSQWISVETLPSEGERAFTDEAWNITMNDITRWEIDWKERYGVLPSGNYRISKEIADFRDSGDYDEKTYYAEFEIND